MGLRGFPQNSSSHLVLLQRDDFYNNLCWKTPIFCEITQVQYSHKCWVRLFHVYILHSFAVGTLLGGFKKDLTSMKLACIAFFCILLSVLITLSSANETPKNETKSCCNTESKCPFLRFIGHLRKPFTVHFWKKAYYKIFRRKDIGNCDPPSCRCSTEEDRQACIKAGHNCSCTLGQKKVVKWTGRGRGEWVKNHHHHLEPLFIHCRI